MEVGRVFKWLGGVGGEHSQKNFTSRPVELRKVQLLRASYAQY